MAEPSADPEAQEAVAKASSGDDGPCETVTLPVSALDRFADSFDRAARRWEFIAYPALLVLVILLAYGFFLIYSLTHDIRLIAQRFDPKMGEHMEAMTQSIDTLTTTIEHMNIEVTSMSDNMLIITRRLKNMDRLESLDLAMISMNRKMSYLEKMATMDENIKGMNIQIATMNKSVGVITANMDRMRYDMTVMNRSVSRPMNFMNSFMPW